MVIGIALALPAALYVAVSNMRMVTAGLSDTVQQAYQNAVVGVSPTGQIDYDCQPRVGFNPSPTCFSLSKLVGARGVVLAYEPQRIVFQALCANLALNQCTNVAAYQEALGAAEGEIVAPAPNPAVRASFGSLSLQGVTQGNKVRLRRLDSLELPLCHFLKIDVEGMETEVLEGARATIARCRPTLYLENDRPDHSRELIQRVFDLGYDAYWHLPPLYNPDNFAWASYLDGHLATTPFGMVRKPVGVSRPRRTTSASSLNVSGTMPVYDTSTTRPDSPERAGLFWTLKRYSSVSGFFRMDPGTT